jgi:hypothetical protein
VQDRTQLHHLHHRVHEGFSFLCICMQWPKKRGRVRRRPVPWCSLIVGL